jgi:hypothetical protein
VNPPGRKILLPLAATHGPICWPRLRTLPVIILVIMSQLSLYGTEPWQDSLAQMPLHTQAREMNRTNCVETFLESFRSNEVVKALVFMPGATDEFYLFRRATAVLTNGNPSVFDAVVALTNQTFIQATFRSPVLLLHTIEDPLKPDNIIKDRHTEDRLKGKVRVGHLSCNDRDWDFLQPILKR